MTGQHAIHPQDAQNGLAPAHGGADGVIGAIAYGSHSANGSGYNQSHTEELRGHMLDGNNMAATAPEAAAEIWELRTTGDIAAATDRCEKALQTFPTSESFAKILSDLYLEQGRFRDAMVALAKFLELAPPTHTTLAAFSKRYHRFRRHLAASEMAIYAQSFVEALDGNLLDQAIAPRIKAIVSQDLPVGMIPETPEFIEASQSDINFKAVVEIANKIEARSPAQLISLLDSIILNRDRSINTYNIDLFCVSLYEKHERYSAALAILKGLTLLRDNPVATRSLLRISRLQKSYDLADEIIAAKPAIIRATEFNVLYELVYYYEFKNDVAALESVLEQIKKSFKTNLPVLRTLRNFYIRLEMFDDAKSIEPLIRDLYVNKGQSSTKFSSEVAESDAELTSKIEELYSQLEHQKQLAAISDLTTGISHELGQPITNIRYTIQFYRRSLEKKLDASMVFAVFDSILDETERMGGLISRLAPLTSSRSRVEEFDVVQKINARFHAESARLQENNIYARVMPPAQMLITGDPVKFDQLISNLLLNAIDAIIEKKDASKRYIGVSAKDMGDYISIRFSDSGVGIPLKNRKKIFDPFFSTKAPGKGEGLGLFILWNILKMQGGKISVDPNFNDGARFLIEIPKIATIQELSK